jgi:acyl-CoA hydrolase
VALTSAHVPTGGEGVASVLCADGPDGPLPDPAVLEALIGRPSSPTPVTTLMLGAGLRSAVAGGRVRDVATRLSAIPGLLAGRLRPDVAVVGATEVDGAWRLVGGPGWAPAAVRAAGQVVIERWPADGSPRPAVGPPLPACRILGVVDRTDPPDPPPAAHRGPEYDAIGRLVAGLLPERATIQWGPGAVGAAVVDAIDRPVRVRSGLVTDQLVGLARRGLLASHAEAAYLWGGPDLHAMVTSGDLVLRDVTVTHDITGLSAIERFVAINTAVQVGLDGAANVELASGRTVSGPGGHPDFAAGASRSPGGLSIVALTASSHGRSNIVAVPEVVSTARTDVDLVVTEHGVADLRGCTGQERVARVLGVAAPEHRRRLEEAAATCPPP